MEAEAMSENREKLKQLLEDVLLLAPNEFSFELHRDQVETWDSMAIVAIAVGVDEEFGHHMKPEEANAVTSVADIVAFLESKGVSFAEEA
jgi:acyl carrier protein